MGFVSLIGNPEMQNLRRTQKISFDKLVAAKAVSYVDPITLDT